MTEKTGIAGDLIYEYTVQFTEVIDYGVPFDAILSGAQGPPAEGARFDVRFEGAAVGPKLRGTVKGVDYYNLRADGRGQLHIHAQITTEDGKRIALAADGVLIGAAGSTVAQVRENVTLTTSDRDYTWVNAIQVWATGTADTAKGEVRIKGYAA